MWRDMMNNDMECAICLEPLDCLDNVQSMEDMTEPYEMSCCRHVLHKHCLMEWARLSSDDFFNCPFCRAPYLKDYQIQVLSIEPSSQSVSTSMHVFMAFGTIIIMIALVVIILVMALIFSLRFSE